MRVVWFLHLSIFTCTILSCSKKSPAELSSTNNSLLNVRDTCVLVADTLTGTKVYPSSALPTMKDGDGSFGSLFNLVRKKIPVPSQDTLEDSAIVQFVVDEKGKFVTGRVICGEILGPHLLAALKDIQWEPARCGGKSVSARYVLPFRITYEI